MAGQQTWLLNDILKLIPDTDNLDVQYEISGFKVQNNRHICAINGKGEKSQNEFLNLIVL